MAATMLPDMPTLADSHRNARKPSRAKQACKDCNARRIRCNVSDMQPCSNCQSSNTPCQILPSRRGRYVRKRRGPSASQDSAATHDISHTSDAMNDVVFDQQSPHADHHDQSAGRPRAPETMLTQLEENGMFFGESNLLTCVAGGVIGPEGKASLGAQHGRRRSTAASGQKPFAGIRPAAAQRRAATTGQMRFLQDEGAFTFPTHDDCLPLVQAYFSWFHPCFPVLDRVDFARLHRAGTLSPLLFQAMLFVGATYCSENAIHRLGLANRREAKSQLYSRAKLLLEAEWETDRLTVLQAVFLLSFRRTGPADFKDVRFWLGMATTLAQSCGLHRRTVSNTRHPNRARMGRRLWWSIYVRDRQSSASLGLPSRILDEDCDVEDLNTEDLEADNTVQGDPTYGTLQPEHIVYVTQMIEVAKLLGKIMRTLFAPQFNSMASEERIKLKAAVQSWKQSLPEGSRDWKESSTIWVNLLHLAYNHLQILIHRKSFLRGELSDDGEDDQLAVDAACRITRIAEDMLSRDMIQFGQMHSITTIFASLCIHTVDIRRSTGMRRKLAEHRAQLCLLGLKEIQRYWKINNTILDLFFQYVDETTAKKLQDDDRTQQSSEKTAAASNNEQRQINGSHGTYTSRATCTTERDASQMRFADEAAAQEDNVLSMSPFNWSMEDMPDDFSWFLNSETNITNELGMQDINMLQRYL